MEHKLQYKDNKVWDAFRGKWVVNTPEEEVRQFIAWYLHRDLGYPKSWISIEKGIKHQSKTYRFDLILYKDAQPFLLVECKAPQVKITQAVFDQIFKYNLLLNIPYLLVSNGHSHFAFKREQGGVEAVSGIPPYL